MLEKDEVLLYFGSYNGVPVALASFGFQSDAVSAFLTGEKNVEFEEIIYIGDCTSSLSSHAPGTVVIADGGDSGLQKRVLMTASHLNIAAEVLPAFPPAGNESGNTDVFDSVTGLLYGFAKEYGIVALSVLTVSENKATGEHLDESEWRRRLYPAAQLVFDVFGTAT